MFHAGVFANPTKDADEPSERLTLKGSRTAGHYAVAIPWPSLMIAIGQLDFDVKLSAAEQTR